MGQMRLRNIYEVFPYLPVDIDSATVTPADETRYENREMLRELREINYIYWYVTFFYQ